MSTISYIHGSLDNLASTQKNVVDAIAEAISSVEQDNKTAARVLKSNADALVITGNNERYAALTQASQKTGGTNYTALVSKWTQEDIVNRAERADLEKTWGTRQHVNAQVSTLAGEINLIQTALKDVSPEIAKFDETTVKIKAHNEKYPKSPITLENHDKFEKFHFGRMLLWLTFIKRGPHKAYQIVNSYTKKYGDYYEDALHISKVRETEKNLKSEEAQKQGSHDQLAAVSRRMGSLDDSYKGPEGIARNIRNLLEDDIQKNPQFAQSLIDGIGGENSQEAALASAKLRTYPSILHILAAQKKNAQETYKDIDDAADIIKKAVGRVGSETVYFDLGSVQTTVERAGNVSRNTANRAVQAGNAVDSYRAAAGTSLFDMERALQGKATFSYNDNNLNLNFDSLTRKVKDVVDAYEREQERLRELERQRLRKLKEEQDARDEQARQERARQQQQQQSQTTSFNRSSENKIGGGTANVTPRSQDKIGGGKNNITPRRK